MYSGDIVGDYSWDNNRLRVHYHLLMVLKNNSGFISFLLQFTKGNTVIFILKECKRLRWCRTVPYVLCYPDVNRGGSQLCCMEKDVTMVIFTSAPCLAAVLIDKAYWNSFWPIPFKPVPHLYTCRMCGRRRSHYFFLMCKKWLTCRMWHSGYPLMHYKWHQRD